MADAPLPDSAAPVVEAAPPAESAVAAAPLDPELLAVKAWEYGESVLGALVILVIGLLAAAWAGKGLRRVMSKRENMDPQVTNISVKLLKLLILLATLVAVLGKFGIQTASIIAVLGGLGLAIGLALQGTLSNVASGVMVMMLRPFTIGDAIKVGGEVYLIDDIGLFVTSAHLPDGPRAMLPNNRLWGNEIVNLSRMHDDLRRIDETFGIAYEDDIDAAMAVIQAVLAADGRYLTDPEPLIAVTSLGDSSVNILCRVWARPAEWWLAKLALVKAVKQAFDRSGITIPFPQRDVHVHPAQSAPAAGEPSTPSHP